MRVRLKDILRCIFAGNRASWHQTHEYFEQFVLTKINDQPSRRADCCFAGSMVLVALEAQVRGSIDSTMLHSDSDEDEISEV